MKRPGIRGRDDSGRCSQHQLCAAEQGQGFAAFLVRHGGVPDLGGFADMGWFGHTGQGAVARGAQMIRLELHRRETTGAFWQVQDATVAGAGVGQGDEGTCMQETIGRHEVLGNGHLRMHFCGGDRLNDHANVLGKTAQAYLIEVLDVFHAVGEWVQVASGQGMRQIAHVVNESRDRQADKGSAVPVCAQAPDSGPGG